MFLFLPLQFIPSPLALTIQLTAQLYDLARIRNKISLLLEDNSSADLEKLSNTASCTYGHFLKDFDHGLGQILEHILCFSKKKKKKLQTFVA